MSKEKKLQLVSTFYTKHLNTVDFFIQSICFALSSIYAKKSGFSINLHTDKRGYEYLKCCPYTNIYCDLEDVDLPSPKLYAAVKFKVMEKYPLGTIHIDGDVFLKNPNLNDLLNFDNYDVIIQSLEQPPLYGFEWKQSASVWDNCTYPEWANRNCEKMYNCGVIGINNEDLRNEYYNTYWNMYNQFLEKGIDKPSVPDLIIEQQFLLDLCENKNYKVKFLIDGNQPSKSANAIGYQHIIGVAKKKEYMQILSMIKKLDIQVYNNLKNKFYGIFRSVWT